MESMMPSAPVQAIVNDAPQAFVDGASQALSLTNDGRLRVSTVPARTGTVFFQAAEEALWGQFEIPLTFTGSPWADW